MRRRSQALSMFVPAVCVAALASSCGGGVTDDTQPIASTSLLTAGEVTTTTVAAPSTTTTAVGVAVIPMAVVGVAGDDVLNIRTGAGVSNDIVGNIAPYSVNVSAYPGEEQTVGSSVWVLVGDPDNREFDAWVNSHFLVAVEGEATQPRALYAAVSEVRDALSRNDSSARLADVVTAMGVPTVVVSADGAFAPEDQVLSAADLVVSDDVRVWGFDDGTGDPVELSVAAFFDRLRQSTALASTERVAVNQRIKPGNTIHNSAEFFPGSTVVELHYGGGDEPDFAWETVRLVFLPAADSYQLVGIALDTWTI